MPQRSFRKSSDFSSRGKSPRRSDRSSKPYKSFKPKSFSRDSDNDYDRGNSSQENAPYTANNSERYHRPDSRPDSRSDGRDRGDFKKKPSKEIFSEYREHRSFGRESQEGRRDFREGGNYRDRERGNGGFAGRGRSQGGRPDWKERNNSYRSGGGYGRDRGERENREPALSLLIGVRPIEEAIRRGVKFNQLYVQKSEDNQPSRFEEFIQYCKNNKINFFFLEKPKLDQLSGHRLHQGVIAELKHDTRVVTDLQSYLTKNPPQGEVVLVLDRLTDQQNVGAITRSAYFFGCKLIISEKTHSAPINEVVHKVSSGASLMVSFYFAEKLSQAINTLKEFGFRVIATSADRVETPTIEGSKGGSETSVTSVKEENTTSPALPSIPLGEFCPTPNLPIEEANYAVVMGSEGSGLRPHLERLADTKIHIPRLSDFDSLNVSVATGIVLYAMMQNGFIQPPKETLPVEILPVEAPIEELENPTSLERDVPEYEEAEENPQVDTEEDPQADTEENLQADTEEEDSEES